MTNVTTFDNKNHFKGMIHTISILTPLVLFDPRGFINHHIKDPQHDAAP